MLPLSKSLFEMGYRNAQSSDLPKIIQIHLAAFPGYFMTLLGSRFLNRYYNLVLAHPGSLLLVKQGEEGLEGFVSGFLDPARFYATMRATRWSLIWPSLAGLCLRPWFIPRLIASYAQARNASQAPQTGVFELSSIAVLPRKAGQGIGRGLVEACLESLEGEASAIVLTTDARGNDPVNKFYLGLGFHLEGSFERSKGRLMNIYRLPLVD